jgi:hypothetical protein
MIFGDEDEINTISEFRDVFNFAKRFDSIEAIKELSLQTIWDDQISNMQHILYSELQKELELSIDLDMPQGAVVCGPQVGASQQNLDIRELSIQHRCNKDKINSAFLIANPGEYMCKMSNAAFEVAMQQRLLLHINGTKKFCMCGCPVGNLLHHAFHCNVVGIRSQVRTRIHAGFKRELINILKHQFNLMGSSNVIPPGEPNLADFFALKQHANQRGEFKNRGDIDIHDFRQGRSLIVDLTFTESTIKLQPDGYNNPGDAAKHGELLKLAQYQQWDLRSTNNEFFVFNVETFAVLGTTAVELLKRFISDDPINRVNELKIFQRVSVALHTVIAGALLHIRRHLTLEDPPPNEYVNFARNSIIGQIG